VRECEGWNDERLRCLTSSSLSLGYGVRNKMKLMELTLTAFVATVRYKSRNFGILSLLTLNIVTRITFGIVSDSVWYGKDCCCEVSR
jgi:hypothetical protein